jgi:hypothetical protein
VPISVLSVVSEEPRASESDGAMRDEKKKEEKKGQALLREALGEHFLRKDRHFRGEQRSTDRHVLGHGTRRPKSRRDRQFRRRRSEAPGHSALRCDARASLSAGGIRGRRRAEDPAEAATLRAIFAIMVPSSRRETRAMPPAPTGGPHEGTDR